MSHKQPSQSSFNGSEPNKVLDSEVRIKPARRTYSAEYKQRILEEAELCTEPGEVGALLRREGLYASNLTLWRRQQDAGTLDALEPKKRGPKTSLDSHESEMAALRCENERLKKQLEQAELIISAQKKLTEALEQTLTAGKDVS